jgi:serine/threonine protein phosphatase PrpC
MSESLWKGYGQTDVGTVRDENQDSFVVVDQIGLWCVADGMGGHKEGGIASHLVTQSLEGFLNEEYDTFEARIDAIKNVLQESNQALRGLSESFYGDDLIGTTVVVLVIDQNRGAVIWAGDSRLYRMRDTAFELLTRDHTQYEALLEKGLIEPVANESEHPASHMLTRAMGVTGECELDVLWLEVQPEDAFLLCSDGLSNKLEQLDLGKVMYYSEDKERAVANMINMALARQANDNVTALIVDRK